MSGKVSALEGLSPDLKKDVRAYTYGHDLTRHIQTLIDEASTRTPTGRTELTFPAGGYRISESLMLRRGVTLVGEGLDLTVLKVFSSQPRAAVLVRPDVGGYVWGGGVERLKLEGNGNCDGILLEATAPSAISQMAFRDLQIRNVRDALVLRGSTSNEVYMNTFENLKVTGVSRCGVAVTTAAYNSFLNVEVTGVGDGAYAFHVEGAGSYLRNLTSDGCCFFDVPFGSVDQLTVEGMLARKPPSKTCIEFRRLLSARNLTLIDIPNGKCSFGVAMRDQGWVLDSVRVIDTGGGRPDFPLGAYPASSGTIINWTGPSQHRVEAYLGADPLQRLHIINSPDLTETAGGGLRLVSELPRPREALRGSLLLLKGRGTKADEIYVCRKDGSGLYVWTNV